MLRWPTDTLQWPTFKNMWELFQINPTFFVSFLKVYLVKKFRYLRENKFVRKTFLTCLSEAQMGWINEIKKCQKISWHCHFKLLVRQCKSFIIIVSLMKGSHLGHWLIGETGFANTFVFAEIFAKQLTPRCVIQRKTTSTL